MQMEYNLKQIKKGIVEMCVLKVLSKNKKLYTLDIIEQIRESGLETSEGTIYPLLTRLKNDGLLNYRWEESTSGPPRKYYGLTQDGHTFLEELNGTWTELSNAVNLITNQTTES